MSDALDRRLQTIFAAGPPVPLIAAYLFGSRGDGRSHAESDIDIGVWLGRDSAHASAEGRFQGGLRLGAWLQAELRDPRVDLVVLEDAPPGLAARVATTGVLVHCSDRELEHAARRDAMLRAADLLPFLRRTRRLKLDALGT